MKIKLNALSEQEIELVHKRTVKILEEAGVCVKSKRAREALLSVGAIAGEDEIIKIPEALLMKSIETAPKSFVLGARNPEYDFKMPADMPGHTMDGIKTEILDMDTGAKRDSTKADVLDLGRIFQSLETASVAWSGCSAMDTQAETHCLHEFAAMIQGTSKHVQTELRHDGESPYAVEILRAILGSDEAIKQRKIISLLYCPISPLAHDDSMMDAYLSLTDYDVPIVAYPMPIIGLTSPSSVFSSLCQINAETLSALVIFQAVKPGLPVIYGCCSGTMDPASGDYVDGPETMLLSMGAVAMARYYDLPCEVRGADIDTIPTYLTWPDLVQGLGTTHDLTFQQELMVIHDEIAKRAYRVMRGIDCSEEKDLTEDIIERGPQGSFLSCKSTRMLVRDFDENYNSKTFSKYLLNNSKEADPMRKIAHNYIKDLLAGPFVDELPNETIQEIDSICDRADKEFSGTE